MIQDPKGAHLPHREQAAEWPSAGTSRRVSRVILSVIFIAGLINMALEMAASRLYAPYLGAALHVWGGLIAVVMVAMACGYAVGGLWGSRADARQGVGWSILVSGVYQACMLWGADALLRASAVWDERLAVVVVSLVLFAPPMAMLSAIGPLSVQILAAHRPAGSAAASVLAVSTVGSVVGVLGASFWSIPEYGTHATRMALCSATLVVSALLFARPIALGVTALGILATFTCPSPSWKSGALFAEESAYNVVRVLESRNTRRLVLDAEDGVHSTTVHPKQFTQNYWDAFSAGPLLHKSERALILGLGAGSSVHTLRAADPSIRIDAVEIDPLVVEAGTRFFGLRPSETLHVFVDDARRYLHTTNAKYGIVQIDLYHRGTFIPFHLATTEFYSEVRDHMNPGAVVMINVVDLGRERPLLASLGRTMKRVFSTVLFAQVSSTNSIVLAFSDELPLLEVRKRLQNPPHHLRRVIGPLRAQLRAFKSSDLEGGTVLTDDRAPIERIVRLAKLSPQASPVP